MGELEHRLRWQDGVVTRRQLLDMGLSEQRVRTMLVTERLVRVYPGVYRSAAHPETADRRVRAAVMWAGLNSEGGAVLAGAAAAWWWGLLDTVPRSIDIMVGRRAHFRPRAGLRLRRIDLDRADRTVYRALPVTTLAYSALFGAVAAGRSGAMMLDRALQGRVRLDALTAVVDRNRGRSGVPAAARLLAAASDESAAESERMLVRLLRGAKVTGWTQNEPVIPGEPWIGDFVFRQQRLVVEVDGWAWHHTPDRFQRDRSKQNALVTAGWTVLRFTWFDLADRPTAVLDLIRERGCR